MTSFYNVPTMGAATLKQALTEFGRRMTPERRQTNLLTHEEFEELRRDWDGVSYEGDFGRRHYVSWTDLSQTELNYFVGRR